MTELNKFKMKIAMGLVITSSYLHTVDISIENSMENNSQLILKEQGYFGEDIFKGFFKSNQQFIYNPNYIINVGDVISVKMWGAYDFMAELTVDKQGNIFLPKVGKVYLLGFPNSRLNQQIKRKMKQVFNSNVFLYADIKQYQPISIFVAGAVNNIGLYEGLSTDSILQFIDKAGGILRGVGSYRRISILRDKKVLKEVDLYDFLLNGNLDTFQFRSGDVILINSVKNFIKVGGEVNRPYIFEIINDESTVKDIMRFIMPKVTVNRFILTQWNEMQEVSKSYALSEAGDISISRGLKLKFFSEYHINTLEVKVEGEHKGVGYFVVKKGKTLYDVLSQVEFTDLSDIKNIRIYRKSVAKIQKQLVETMLKDLEARVFTTDSSTVEESSIRAKESSMIVEFIERVRKVEPLGQVIINDRDNLGKIYLEEGDRVVVPKYSNIVVVQGEVNIPNALVFREGLGLEDYISLCGGYGERANMEKILLIKANGQVILYAPNRFLASSSVTVEAGDSILVLAKTDSKNILIASSITQILYQVAIAAAVVLRAF